jgi:hypothetical protein
MDVNENDKSIQVSQGDVRMNILFQQKQKLAIKQFSEIPYPPERNEKDQWHIIASTNTKTVSTKIVTVMIPYKKDKEPDISIDNYNEEENEVSLELSMESKKYSINLLPEAIVRNVR